MVLARSLRITFSHRSAPAGTLLTVAGSSTNPAVWSLALWQVAQYLPMTALACWESKACARADGESSRAVAAITMKNLIIGSQEASIYTTGVIISTAAADSNGGHGDPGVSVIY